MIEDYIKKHRADIEKQLTNSPKKKYLSPAIYSQYQITLPLIKLIARGNLIDLGCGNMPFRAFIERQVTAYHGLDKFPTTPSVTYEADIQNMSIIADQSYDVALCIEVLEHVPNPRLAIREVRRILRLGGNAIITVPHLSRLHDEPYDYYRYTKYGLEYLLSSEGLKVIQLVKRGGIFSFLGHQLSTILVGIAWGVPGLRQLVWWINSWLVTRLCFNLDAIFDKRGIFAMGYTVVAERET